ncbi:MAG: Cna B-type domain-containing protein, partial [Candidatus Aphodomorpha sp.]
MKRRLPASILAVLMMALVIVAAQTALGAPATTVRGDIPVEKLWDHGSLPAAQQPQSVTVKLMQGNKMIQQITLTEGADGRWTGVFVDVPLLTNGAPIDYTVTEAPLSDYAMTVVQLPFPGSVSDSTWSEKITPASESTYPLGEAEIVVANKGGTYDIWSLNTLNAVQQQALVDEINRANLQGFGAALKLGTGGNTEFRFGLPAVFYDKKGNSVEIREGADGTEIEFGETSVWSLFYSGGITVEDARGAVIKNTYQAPSTPTPTATPTPTPTPTATPTPTPTPTPT